MNVFDLLHDALKKEHARRLELCPASERVKLAGDQAVQRIHLRSCVERFASMHSSERAALCEAVFALAGVE